jgi:hypothetical protein
MWDIIRYIMGEWEISLGSVVIDVGIDNVKPKPISDLTATKLCPEGDNFPKDLASVRLNWSVVDSGVDGTQEEIRLYYIYRDTTQPLTPTLSTLIESVAVDEDMLLPDFQWDDMIDLTPGIAKVRASQTVYPTYYYTVISMDRAGNRSDPSNEASPVEVPCEEPVCVGTRGDPTKDGRIDVLDALITVNSILYLIVLDECQLIWADCNGDESVNILDVIGIVNVILGIGECAPGACKSEVTAETLEFMRSLRSYFSPEDFDRFMTLVKSETHVPTEYGLAQNYPNPFNPTTSIQYSVVSEHSSPHVILKIFNLLGQEVRILVDEVQEPGYYTVTWDGCDGSGNEVASGVYFYQLSVDGPKDSGLLRSGQWSATKRMVLMK